MQLLHDHVSVFLLLCLIFVPTLSIAEQQGPFPNTEGGTPFTSLKAGLNGFFGYYFSIRAGRRIDAIQIGRNRHGGGGGREIQLHFARNECITRITVYSGVARNIRKTQSVFALTVHTNLASYGPYGKPTRNSVLFAAPQGEEVIGFFGRSGRELDSIGIITAPTHCSS